MTRTLSFAFLAAVTAIGCARPTPEQQIIDDAAAALGGRDRIEAVRTLIIEGEGMNGNLGQDMLPDSTSEAFKVTGYRRAVDLASGSIRIEQVRTPNFTYFQGQQPQKQVLGLAGDVGYNVAPNGTASRVSNAVAGDRRAEFYHHPLTIIRAALNSASSLSNPRVLGNESIVDVKPADGRTFTLAIDRTTKLPTRVVSMADNTNLGDVAVETSFADYQDISSLKLPARLTTKVDKYTTAEINVTKQSVDADVGDLAAPQAAASAAAIAGPLPANVTAEPVAKGIWFLAGQSHNSVLVEFADHLTLIEAPQNDTRSLAVIAKARELQPAKALTEVVNSHHHFDHSGGIRAAVSEGLTVITYKANAPFYNEVVGRSHTIVPDALAVKPKPLTTRTVDEELALQDKTMTVNLYHIAGSPHADTLLMAYFPRERVLVEADVFNPGSSVQPFAANLLDNIKQRKLRVDRIVPLHGAIAKYDDLVKSVQAAPAAH